MREKGFVFCFYMWLLLGIYLTRMISYLKKEVNGWDHLMHAIEVGDKNPNSYPFGTKR